MSLPLPAARELVMAYGWNASAYQILNRGIELWPAPRDAGVVGYVARGDFVVAAGPPVCPASALPRVTGDFEAWARSTDRRACFFGVESRLFDLLRDSPDHATLAIGAQPVWDPHGWPEIVRRRSSLRAQLNRARNKGVT